MTSIESDMYLNRNEGVVFVEAFVSTLRPYHHCRPGIKMGVGLRRA